MKLKKSAMFAIAIILCILLTSCHLVVVDEVDPSKLPSEKDESVVTLPEPDKELESLETQIHTYLSELFDKAYQPYYEGLNYEISDYNEEISENEFFSTFCFTMWHLDSGGDIGSERGKLTQANFHLMAKGTYADGVAVVDSVLMNTNPVLNTEYSVPVQNAFPDENATLSLTGYIKEINVTDRKVYFDKVFFLTTPENDELLGQLGFDVNNLPNGYHLYNPEESVFEYEIAQDADFYRNNMTVDRPWSIVETELSMIADTLNTQTPLYKVVVKNGVVTTISEIYLP